MSSVLVAGTTVEAWRSTPGHRIALAAAVSDALPGRSPPRRAAPGVPVLVYHNPAVSAPGIETSTVSDLAVEGIEDSSGSTNRPAELAERDVTVYVGSPTMLALAGACGARGALLALANAVPTLCIAAWNGDMAAQRRLFAVHRSAAAEYPGFLKSAEPA